jgi:hypothetical protein
VGLQNPDGLHRKICTVAGCLGRIRLRVSFQVADIRSESATEFLWQSFSHLQHGVVILFMRELTRNLPPPTKIELHGNRVRPNDAKAARLVTSGSYLSFALREQSASNTLSAVLAKYPQVANPLLIRYDHADNLVIRNCHPCQWPIFIFELKGDGIRSKKVLKCFVHHSLD